MQAPAKQVVLTNTKNKIQLNAMITDGILNPCYFTEATPTHTLSIVGVRDVPVEITGGLMIDRHGLYSTHEEADILIAQHAISYLLLGKCVRGVCDDRDVFVLLVHYYNIGAIVASVPQWLRHHRWRNEQWYIFVPPCYNIVT